MLPSRGGDAERLLHQTVRLVSVAIRTLIWAVAAVIVAASALGGLACSRHGGLRHARSSSLALHFTICQKAA